MSTHDSGRPPHPARRLVLRKRATPAPPAPASLPPIRPPPVRASLHSIPPPGESIPPPADTSAPLFERPAHAPPPQRLAIASHPTTTPSHPAIAPAPVSTTSPLEVPTSATPLPRLTRPSVPPVVAGPRVNVTPHEAASARKAGVLGAVIGLAFVALFVVGARMTYHPRVRAAAAASPTKPAAPKLMPPAPLDLPPPPPTLADPAPAVARTPATRRIVPMARPAGAATGTAKAQAPEGSESGETAASDRAPTGPGHAPQVAPVPRAADTAGRRSAAAATNGASTAGDGADPAADSPPSLDPVIPAAPPPEVDPLVKAVLEDDRK